HAEEARIRVEPLVPTPGESDIADAAKGILEALLSMMGVAASVVSLARIGNKRSLSGVARFNQRNLLPKGSIEYTNGQE
ncbi:unnamed protein product, partial [marine sediment metagenome]